MSNHIYFGTDDLILVDAVVTPEPNGQMNATVIYRCRNESIRKVTQKKDDRLAVEISGFEGYQFVLTEDPSIRIGVDGFATITYTAIALIEAKGGRGEEKYIYGSELTTIYIPYRTEYISCFEGELTYDTASGAVTEQVLRDVVTIKRLQPATDKSIPPRPSDPLTMYTAEGSDISQKTYRINMKLAYVRPPEWTGNFSGVTPDILVSLESASREQITANLFEVSAKYAATQRVGLGLGTFVRKPPTPCT